jgi:hypothetical protein
MEGGKLIGVVTVGRPISRRQCDGYTAEVTRCCVLDGHRNANSKLYAAAIRAAWAMGYRRVITYTLPSESGASLKAVGFRMDGMTQYNSKGWDMPGRPRKTPEKYPVGPKMRWIKENGAKADSYKAQGTEEAKMKAYIRNITGRRDVDTMAEHILRNYSIEQCAELGANTIKQAYNLLRSRFDGNGQRKEET